MEGFVLKNRFVLKELVVFNADDKWRRQFLIKPPCHASKLSLADRNAVKYLQTFRHRIGWNSGFVSLRVVSSYLKRVTTGHDVFTKGNQKTTLLKGFCSNARSVTNLEDFGCPKVDNIKFNIADSGCQLYYHRGNKHCALYKAIVFSRFLRNQYLMRKIRKGRN